MVTEAFVPQSAPPPAAGVVALRPYQREVGRAVLSSVLGRQGHTFTVEIARQGGKNELSAQLELLLLIMHLGEGGDAVKAAPTFQPQALISLRRLTDRLRQAGLGGLFRRERGYMVRLGRAREIFLSAEPSAQVVGATASVLLELDEAQDVDREKFNKEFRPMGAAANVTTVLYGTPWDDATLLEEAKQHNLELERKDGQRRHFRYDWEEVARYVPAYGRYVEEERQRLGETHPLFLTQYRLQPLPGGGGFLSPSHRAQLQGPHPRQRTPQPGTGAIYVAGLDLAGGSPDAASPTDALSLPAPIAGRLSGRDSTVVTIGRLDYIETTPGVRLPRVEVVEHYWWTGQPHASLYPRLLDLLGKVWACQRVAVDATGLGEGVASFLREALGAEIVAPFYFTAPSKSHLGFQLMGAVNTGRLKTYARDGSPECQEFWLQVERAQRTFRANQTMNFFVDPARGHDDFLMSLALLVEATETYQPRPLRQARGRLRE